jgi:hypothetical protein
MSILFGGVTSSQRLQLAVTSILSAGIAVGVVLSYQQLRREIRVKRLKESIPDIPEEYLLDRVYLSSYSSTYTVLISEAKLNEYGGAAADAWAPSKEDENSVALALRARQGDYDDGMDVPTKTGQAGYAADFNQSSYSSSWQEIAFFLAIKVWQSFAPHLSSSLAAAESAPMPQQLLQDLECLNCG